MSDINMVEVLSEDDGITPVRGFCYLCNSNIEADVRTHFDQEHRVVATKPKAPMLSWEHRLANIQVSLREIQEDGDRGRQINKLDDLLQELYLVRARLAQLKQVKEG
jgi:hypothetical protein